ncbi:MAG: DUF839 domain-containing protein [Acidobacteriia bacterium]|nr:DUF839 domain-containing protein [Terriglobia bacterium]
MKHIRARLLTLLFAAAIMVASAFAEDGGRITGVPFANAKSGHPDNVISPGFKLIQIAQGTDKLENPSGIITNYGLLNDAATQRFEATHTEGDENTYLMFDHNLGGPTAGFNYGRHYLFQGHENGAPRGYVTRINLDVTDPAHRITLLTPVGTDGTTGFGSIDGSVWNPFTKSLLFTQERGTAGGVIEITPDWPSTVRTLDGIIGKGGFEGIHPDNKGNLWISEDSGGPTTNVDPANPSSPKAARQPNSFVFRFVPKDPSDLSKGGMMQALQVTIDGHAVVFGGTTAAQIQADVFAVAQLKLNTPGSSWPVKFVNVHDSTGCVPNCPAFDANAEAKKAGATPFKRPENGLFRPGSNFQSFFFTVTGDTDANSGNTPALAARGSWGSIFRVDFRTGNDQGKISIVVLGDADHASFDNISFLDRNTIITAEDRGDGLHTQLNKLDSIWSFRLSDDDDDDHGGVRDARFVALGRDTVSEQDSILLGTPGFQNDGDNEPTGTHVSNGDTSVRGLLGTRRSLEGTRVFFSQQHGLNRLFEVVRTEKNEGHDHDGRD